MWLGSSWGQTTTSPSRSRPARSSHASARCCGGSRWRLSDTGATVRRHVTLDPVSRECVVGGGHVELTRLEFDLLAELIAHPRIVYTRERLLEKVWGHQTPVGGKTIDVHVANLRRKLDGWPGIVAVRGIGYKLDPDES